MSALPSDPKPGVKPTRLEWCEVRRWRGYRTATFFAEDETGLVVAESGAFRGDGDAARARHRELLDALESLGWHASDEGGNDWFATRLSRVVEREPEDDLTPPAVAEPVVHRVAPVVAAPPAPVPAAPVAAPARVTPAPVAAASAPVVPAPAAGHVRQRPGWQRALLALAVLVAVAGVAGAVLVVAERLRPDVVVRTRTVTVVQSAPAPKPKAEPAATPGAASPPAATTPPAARRVRLSVVGGTRASWVEIRRSSAKGRVLYAGNVDPGQRLTFTAPRIWTRFGAAGNLQIRANGRLVPLLGTIEHTFRP